jgi:hypothetical protein
LLAELNTGLDPVKAARLKAAELQRQRIEEQRNLSGGLRDTELEGLTNVLGARTAGAGNIYDATLRGAGGVRDAATLAAQKEHEANVTELAKVLGVRREAAEQIYNASTRAAGGLRDARTTGAEGIYGAELLSADTYAQSNELALARSMALQAAERARKGFSGGSSGSDLMRARLTAEALQKGAGARAQAGVNKAGRLSDAGIGYAGDMGTADVRKQTTYGAAAEGDSIAKLNAAVALARSLGVTNTNYAANVGNADVTKATTLAGAGEADAIGRLTARVEDARRKLGYLTSDADIAVAKAEEQNALDGLNALIADQNRRTGSVGLPFQLAGADLAYKQQVGDAKYNDIDSLLRRIQGFTIGGSSGPMITTPTPGPVLNTGQIIAGGLSGLGTAVGAYGQNKDLASAIAAFGRSSSPVTQAPNNSYNGATQPRTMDYRAFA